MSTERTHRRRVLSPVPAAALPGLVLGAMLACAGWPGSPAASEPPGSESPFELAAAQAALRDVILTGFTRARAEYPLVSETAGRVLQVFCDIGDTVDPAGAFARVDDTFIRLKLEEISVEQERLQAQIEYDGREAARYRELTQRNSASASQLDALEQSLRDNNHALRILEVKRRTLVERLARTTVRAPAGWRIVARSVEPGQWVQEGETLGRAADFSTLVVPFALTPEQYEVLRKRADGAPDGTDTGSHTGADTGADSDARPAEGLTVTLSDQGRRIPARIYRSNPGFDPDTRKIAVELQLAAPVEPARGGLRVELALGLPERTGAVSLPERALERTYEEYWITRADGERIRVVLLGPDRTAPGRVRVSAPGLKPGERFRLGKG